ncbi:glycosyltransferase [Anaerolinea thermolimosa]|uniref:glycosyltransferase family 4 protein n=1 Tax=Anaerolinea thermolimosa TaxID=229919 RepID=UPI00078032C3|nr:glycosyltransferase family 4 protein [Anaerolinea thermolimosa]GAP08048.1 glycosyltransferase [Anaerolinea thermolimosa]
MRILLGVHHFPPVHQGGAELRALRTAQQLQSRGMDVHVFCVEDIEFGSSPGCFVTEEVYEGLPLTRLFLNAHLYPDPHRFEYENLWIEETARELIHRLAPQLFHLFSGYLLSGSVIVEAKRAGLPVCLSLTDFWFLCREINKLTPLGRLCPLSVSRVDCVRCEAEHRRRYRVLDQVFPPLMTLYWQLHFAEKEQIIRREAFLQRVLAQVDLMISPSQFLRSVYIRAGIPAERIVFCRQGRDFPGLTPENLVKTPSEKLRLGYTGQIAPHKGVHLLIKALQMLPGLPLSVVIYGDMSRYPQYAHCLEKASTRDSRIHLMGAFPEGTPLWKIYQEMDVQIVPSLWYENSPNVILEAFAHRTPVITSNQGGMAEMVQDGVDGLHFEHGNAKSLAACIGRLNQDRGLLRRLQDGIQPVRSTSQEVDELIEVYQKILVRSPEHRGR